MRTFTPKTSTLPPALQAQPVSISRACRQLSRDSVCVNQHHASSKFVPSGVSKRACKVSAAAPAAPDLEAPKEPAPPTRPESESNGASEEFQVVAESRPVAPETSASTSGQTDQQEGASATQAVAQNGSGAPKPQQRPRFNKQGGSYSRNNNSQQKRQWRRRGPVENFPYKVGDTVVGTVVGCTNGWRVALEFDKDIVGFVSANNMPHILRDNVTEPEWDTNQVGLTREFRIELIPEDLEYNGKGPLMTARGIDLEVIWSRANQILDVCKNEREHITALMSKTNAGGLLGSFEGLPLFVPYSYIPRMKGGEHPRSRGSEQNREEAAQQFVGQMTPVSVWEINRKQNKFVGNIIEAMNNRAYSSIAVGDLVWGEVSSVEGYGVFVRLDKCPSVKALLHIGSISRAHVDNTRDLFEHGERVHAVVSGVDMDKRRVNLSTAEIEPEAGDMLFSKAKVYENAEKQVQDFRSFVEQRQKEIESGEYADGEDELEWNS